MSAAGDAREAGRQAQSDHDAKHAEHVRRLGEPRKRRTSACCTLGRRGAVLRRWSSSKAWNEDTGMPVHAPPAPRPTSTLPVARERRTGAPMLPLSMLQRTLLPPAPIGIPPVPFLSACQRSCPRLCCGWLWWKGRRWRRASRASSACSSPPSIVPATATSTQSVLCVFVVRRRQSKSRDGGELADRVLRARRRLRSLPRHRRRRRWCWERGRRRRARSQKSARPASPRTLSALPRVRERGGALAQRTLRARRRVL